MPWPAIWLSEAGLARHPSRDIEGVQAIAADLLDPAGLRAALDTLRPTHIFFATWMRQPTEAENIKINAAMVRNLAVEYQL